MFPGSNYVNNDPILSIDHSILPARSHDHDDLPLSFFHLPSPNYYDQCELELQQYHDVFRNQLQYHDNDDPFLLHQKALFSSTDNNSSVINMTDSRNITGTDHSHRVLPVKRSASKTDRHSKINTANGPRDRRMRLSLDVARDFFGLQDMLGYDKPSRTVEWLLIQAKQEINKLTKSQVSQMNDSFGLAVSKSPSSTNSEAEVMSGIDKAASEGTFSKGKGCKKEKKDRVRQRKTSFRPLARDLREKARERAKARTAKIMLSRRWLGNETTNNDPNKLGCWSNQDQENKANPFSQADNMVFNCLQNAGINQEHQLITGSVHWQTMGGLLQ